MTIPAAEDHSAIAKRMRELELERNLPLPVEPPKADAAGGVAEAEIEAMMFAGVFPYMGAP